MTQQQQQSLLATLDDARELTSYSKTWYIKAKNQVFILPFPNKLQPKSFWGNSFLFRRIFRRISFNKEWETFNKEWETVLLTLLK